MTNAAAALTAVGAPFEIVDELVLGERMPVFRNRIRSARELLDASAHFGDAEYLVNGEQRLSFRAHLVAVAEVAAALRVEYGVEQGDRVAILAANSAEWVIAFWATLSLGAVVASMNAWWAPPEIDHAIRSCEPKVVIADARRRAVVQQIDRSVRCIAIESDIVTFAARSTGTVLDDVLIDEDDAAVILYTSGTTGRAKGAIASHRALCGTVTLGRYSGAVAATAAVVTVGDANTSSPRQVALITVPLFHASGLYGFVVGHLANGGTLVLRDGRFDEDDVLRLIEAERVTMWAALGSMGPRVAARAGSSDRDLSSLRVLAIGGAPVSPAHQAQLRAAFPHASQAMSMGYTSSEAVAVVTRNGGQELLEHPTSAGRIQVTTAVEIRDADGAPVADGVDGEIHVRSPYLMLGYWGDPAATSAALKPGRWLSMGDIGCMSDGRLYINSRARDMMLVNAENVFPTEIEYRLDAHPAVRESAVIGVANPTTGQAICAFVVGEADAVLVPEDLRSWCREAMAGYKVPTQWVIRREPLPRNPSGKVLKRDLELEVDPAPSR
jgi:long-chain acyl-CoA synthetase